MEAKIITRTTPAQTCYTVMYGTDCVAVPLKKEHADLIVAAPDLLAALIACIEAIEDATSAYTETDWANGHFVSAWDAAHAAIAKAEGR